MASPTTAFGGMGVEPRLEAGLEVWQEKYRRWVQVDDQGRVNGSVVYMTGHRIYYKDGRPPSRLTGHYARCSNDVISSLRWVRQRVTDHEKRYNIVQYFVGLYDGCLMWNPLKQCIAPFSERLLDGGLASGDIVVLKKKMLLDVHTNAIIEPAFHAAVTLWVLFEECGLPMDIVRCVKKQLLESCNMVGDEDSAENITIREQEQYGSIAVTKSELEFSIRSDATTREQNQVMNRASWAAVNDEDDAIVEERVIVPDVLDQGDVNY